MKTIAEVIPGDKVKDNRMNVVREVVYVGDCIEFSDGYVLSHGDFPIRGNRYEVVEEFVPKFQVDDVVVHNKSGKPCFVLQTGKTIAILSQDKGRVCWNNPDDFTLVYRSENHQNLGLI